MQIVEYSIKDLRTALKENLLWKTDVVPITKHRALLLINNPRASEEDVVLLVAYENENVIGYRAIFPDKIFIKNREYKIAWGSSFWVDPSYRGKGIGKKLLIRGMEIYNNNIGSLTQSAMAARVYQSSDQFFEFNKGIGYTAVIKSNLYYWIPKKFKPFKKVVFMFRLVDFIINLFINLKLPIWGKIHSLKNIKLEYVTKISDKETADFIASHNLNDLSRKSANEINHILENPTTLATPLKDSINNRYYFAANSEIFNYYAIRVLNKTDDLIAFILLNVNGKHLRVPYFFCDDDNIEKLIRIVAHHIIKLKSEMVTLYNPKLVDAFNKYGIKAIIKKKRVKTSYLPKEFQDVDFTGINIQDGDGA